MFWRLRMLNGMSRIATAGNSPESLELTGEDKRLLGERIELRNKT
jgi:hypothetical protein